MASALLLVAIAAELWRQVSTPGVVTPYLESQPCLRYFHVSAEDHTTGARPLAWIEGQHRWTLPTRIGCPDCTIYGAIGPAYPSVDLTHWPEAETLAKPSAASWRQFAALRDRLASVVPPGLLLSPGAEFGQFSGTVRGGPVDFVHSPIHLLFATPAAVARLQAAGISLPPRVPAQLRGRGRTPTDFVEFDVPRGGQLAREGYTLREPAPCATCGRWDRTLDTILLETGSAPKGEDLLRPANHPTVLLASERLVTVVREAELTGLTFHPVENVVADTQRVAATDGRRR